MAAPRITESDVDLTGDGPPVSTFKITLPSDATADVLIHAAVLLRTSSVDMPQPQAPAITTTETIDIEADPPTTTIKFRVAGDGTTNGQIDLADQLLSVAFGDDAAPPPAGQLPVIQAAAMPPPQLAPVNVIAVGAAVRRQMAVNANRFMTIGSEQVRFSAVSPVRRLRVEVAFYRGSDGLPKAIVRYDRSGAEFLLREDGASEQPHLTSRLLARRAVPAGWRWIRALSARNLAPQGGQIARFNVTFQLWCIKFGVAGV